MKGNISSATPSLLLLSDNFHSSSSTQFSPLRFTSSQLLLKSNPTCLSSSSSSVVEQEDQDSPDALPLSGCKGCGREQTESGCNGDGRIQGGIATIPGFGWWPIKAYRPCPGFLASGGNYNDVAKVWMRWRLEGAEELLLWIILRTQKQGRKVRTEINSSVS